MSVPFLIWSLTLAYTVRVCSGTITEGVLPQELQDCYSQNANVSLEGVVGQTLLWQCESTRIRRLENGRARSIFGHPSARNYLAYLTNNLRNLMQGTHRQDTPKCVRKEYRRLTDQERERFHRAINALKQNTSVTPNKYDVWAAMHSGDVIPMAHDGPNFLGWHRAFLLILEKELQTVDPSVCLAYWDSSLDSELPVPANSFVFSEQFLGGRGSNGPVVDGPFAGWVTPQFGPLSRNLGANGQLFTTAEIRRVLSKRSTSEITPPNAPRRDQLEIHHNDVHIFVGGQMNILEASAHDPAFFLHHAFVDYIWERFRQRQRRLGINPEQDYPSNFGRPEHGPDRPMGFDFNITNAQGYLDNMTDTYEYEATPTCSRWNRTCGSRYLQCDVRSRRCIPIDPSTTEDSNRRMSPKLTYQSQRLGIQNNYCIDGVCDSRLWVYIGVKVVAQRSPDLLVYECFPFYNGNISKQNDIYQPRGYPETRQYIQRKSPKPYAKCQDEGIGQIFIQSHGLSYDGYYKESIIIDQRLPTSVGVGYLAVKNPYFRPVKTLVRAFDSCGRVCKVACKMHGSRDFQLCSGVLDINNRRPRMYSHTVGQVTIDTFEYPRNRATPSFTDNNIVVAFYCDYDDRLQWGYPEHYRSGQNASECQVDPECTIDIPCHVARHHCNGERYKCRGTCNKYAECSSGFFWKKTCPEDWSFDMWTFGCNSQLRCNNAASSNSFFADIIALMGSTFG